MNLSVISDIWFLIPILGLTGISLSIIGSTTNALFPQHIINFILGFTLFYIFSSIDYRLWIRFKWLFYFLSIVLLVILFFNSQIRGVSRWIDIGQVHIQPSEIIKPFVTIFLTALIIEGKGKRIREKILPFVLFFPILFLIFKQPDLGNALVFLFMYLALEISHGFKLLYLFFIAVIGGLLWPLFFRILKNYQRERLFSFINPHSDPAGTGYNAIQAMIALGSGQLLGLGLGRGTQSHLLFLPEYHTDFVFASLGEELGFAGGFIVIILYMVLLGRILKISVNSKDEFGKFLTIGVFAQLFFHVFVNIGMNLGILPITGITLPLLSYGGSSILSTFICLGMTSSVGRIGKNDKSIVIR